MKTMATLVVITVLAMVSASAAVQTVLFQVTSNASFPVPAGKVLIVERMVEDEIPLSSIQNYVEFYLTNNVAQISLGVEEKGNTGLINSPKISVPFKVPGMWTVAVQSYQLNPPEGDIEYSRSFWLFGLLVDNSDLYASLKSEIKDVEKQGGTLAMEIQTSSPRPAKVTVEKSNPVGENWQPATEAVVTPTEDKTKYVATVPVDQDKNFFRAKVTPAK